MYPGWRVIRAMVTLAAGTRSPLANRGDGFHIEFIGETQLSGHPAGELCLDSGSQLC
jgi:hypothetical protein